MWQVGPGVPRHWFGKRVWLYNGPRNGRWMGTAAEYIALSVDLVTELPDHVSFAEGATLGVPAMTAHRAVFVAGPVQGKTLLVTGGARSPTLPRGRRRRAESCPWRAAFRCTKPPERTRPSSVAAKSAPSS